jgi:uncharacterized protein YbjT (DUF2867 family)
MWSGVQFDDNEPVKIHLYHKLKSIRMEGVYRRPVIAIAGATGDLGSHLVKAFLEGDLFSQLSGLILLSRRHTPRTETWKSKGAQVRIVDETGDIGELVDALEGVDVLVNA